MVAYVVWDPEHLGAGVAGRTEWSDVDGLWSGSTWAMAMARDSATGLVCDTAKPLQEARAPTIRRICVVQ